MVRLARQNGACCSAHPCAFEGLLIQYVQYVQPLLQAVSIYVMSLDYEQNIQCKYLYAFECCNARQLCTV